MNEANIVLLNAESPGILNQDGQLATVFEKTAMPILVFDSAAYLSYANPAGRDLFDNYESNVGQKLPADSGYTSLHQLLERSRLSQDSLTGDVVWSDQRVFSAEVIPIQGSNYAVTLFDVSRFTGLEKLKNEIFAAAVHDLRGPITSIIGFGHLIKKMGPLTDPQQEAVQHIQNAAANMSELVENMLNLTKIELGGESKHDTFNLTPVLWEIADEFQQHAEGKKQLLMVGEVAMNSIVQGDAFQIRQALRNLVGNAVKYTPTGGTIMLSLHREAGNAQIKVKDTGHGMPASELPHIFKRFYRVSNYGHNEIQGSGLGLAIVKSVAERHGGDVTVDSEVGKGSCFTLTLPLAQLWAEIQ